MLVQQAQHRLPTDQNRSHGGGVFDDLKRQSEKTVKSLANPVSTGVCRADFKLLPVVGLAGSEQFRLPGRSQPDATIDDP